MALSQMALSQMALSLMALSLMALSLMALSLMALIITTIKRIILNIETLFIMPENILPLGQATLDKRQAQTFLFIMPFISLEKGNNCNDQKFIIHRDNKFRNMFNDCEIIKSFRFCKDTQPSDNQPKDTQPNLALEWTLIIIIINIMTFSIQTLSSMTQSKTTQSLMTLSETKLNTTQTQPIFSFLCHLFRLEMPQVL